MTVVFGETMDGSHMAIDQFSLKSNAVTLNSPYTADKDQLNIMLSCTRVPLITRKFQQFKVMKSEAIDT